MEFLAKTTLKAHPYPWHADEDPDVGDYSCNPGDGMPVRPCEHALHHHTVILFMLADAGVYHSSII